MTYLRYGFTEAMNVLLGVFGGHPQMVSGDRPFHLVRHAAGVKMCTAEYCQRAHTVAAHARTASSPSRVLTCSSIMRNLG